MCIFFFIYLFIQNVAQELQTRVNSTRKMHLEYLLIYFNRVSREIEKGADDRRDRETRRLGAH